MGKGHQLHAKFVCTSKIICTIFSIPTIIFQSQIGTPISNSYIMSMRAVGISRAKAIMWPEGAWYN